MAQLTLFEKLDQIETKYQELTAQISSPEVMGDSAQYQKLARTHADLAQMVEKYREWKEIEKGLLGTKQMLMESEDAEMKQLAHDEERHLNERREKVEDELKLLLLPKIPTTTRTSSSKSAPAPAATKPRSSPPSFSACTRATPNRSAGRSKCSRARRHRSAA